MVPPRQYQTRDNPAGLPCGCAAYRRPPACKLGPDCRMWSLTWGCRHRRVRWDRTVSNPVVVRGLVVSSLVLPPGHTPYVDSRRRHRQRNGQLAAAQFVRASTLMLLALNRRMLRLVLTAALYHHAH